MATIDIDSYTARSRALDLRGIRWGDVPRHPLSAEARRTLRYMQDIETHTIVYLRTLLSTRAMDDPEVATFLACWFYEETFHGRALARFLAAAGEPVAPRPRSRMTLAQWAEARATALVARVWPDFVGIHMVWGAINELTTLVGYQRLATLAAHPVLTELLARIIRDESRHFAFYYSQATGWLARSGTARLGRFLVDHFWAPVGSGVQPAAETRFLARYLFAGEKGWEASRRVDATIRRLPGFEDVALLEAWVGRAAREPIAAPGRVPSAMAHDGRHRGVYASARMSAAPRSSSGRTTSASADGSAKIARSTPSPEFCLSASSSIGAP